MKKLVFFGILGFSIIGCRSSKTYFLMISDKITKTYVNKKFQKRNLSKEARENVYKKASFLIESKKDTIYILEGYDFETALVYGRIWTTQNSIDYTYRRKRVGKELTINAFSSFNNNEIALITKWDTINIRRQEINPNNFVSNIKLEAYRCYPIEDKVGIERIIFNEF